MVDFTRTGVVRPLRRAVVLLLLSAVILPASLNAAPTFGMAPIFAASSYKSSLSSYDFSGEPNAHVGLGGSVHLTTFLRAPFGARFFFSGIYFPPFQETYLIPDNNSFQNTEGTVNIEKSMIAYYAGVEIMFSMTRRVYGFFGGSYYLRTWNTHEWGTVPMANKLGVERVDLRFKDKNSGYATRMGLGTRIGRRTTGEVHFNFDTELTQVEVSLNYLVPLNFLSKRSR